MRSTLAALLIVDLAHALPHLPGYNRGPSYDKGNGTLVNGHTPLEPPTSEEPYYISFGPRPYYIINNMTDGPLKTKLQSCENGPFSIS